MIYKHVEMGMKEGVLNGKLLDNNNIRIICLGEPEKYDNTDKYIDNEEWFYYSFSIFNLIKEELELLYNVNVKSFTTEWCNSKGNRYVDSLENNDKFMFYIIPNILTTWNRGIGTTGFVYRGIGDLLKLAFEKPEERIITNYIWSNDRNNIYRRFNRVYIREHERQIDLNIKLKDLLKQAENCIIMG